MEIVMREIENYRRQAAVQAATLTVISWITVSVSVCVILWVVIGG